MSCITTATYKGQTLRVVSNTGITQVNNIISVGSSGGKLTIDGKTTHDLLPNSTVKVEDGVVTQLNEYKAKPYRGDDESVVSSFGNIDFSKLDAMKAFFQ